jgi:hypothetical protein
MWVPSDLISRATSNLGRSGMCMSVTTQSNLHGGMARAAHAPLPQVVQQLIVNGNFIVFRRASHHQCGRTNLTSKTAKSQYPLLR